MPGKANLMGKRFGRLIAISEEPARIGPFVAWNCRCDCGNIKIVRSATLINGKTQSCGCSQKQRAKEARTKHGFACRNRKGPEYRTWIGMNERCYNESRALYKNYGGRGISVCERWRNSFVAFYEDMGPKPRGMTIERKNNNGDYEPSNCVWATRRDQARNKRNTKLLTVGDRTQSLAAWAEETGLPYETIRLR